MALVLDEFGSLLRVLGGILATGFACAGPAMLGVAADPTRPAVAPMHIRWRRLTQRLVFAALVRPFLRLVLGFRTENAAALPQAGPAVLVANHNSHLDTLALMAMMPPHLLHRVRPVAAADHFSRGLPGLLARTLLSCLLVPRDGRGAAAALAGVVEALQAGDIVILFPEGSRGEPEVMAPFRGGVAHLAQECPEASVHPVRLDNLGRSLPKGARLVVPFTCTAVVGPPVRGGTGGPASLPARLEATIRALRPAWQGPPPDAPSCQAS
jgi:1-acyl-sn-glycerol-3-phosphate acyltransferase